MLKRMVVVLVLLIVALFVMKALIQSHRHNSLLMHSSANQSTTLTLHPDSHPANSTLNPQQMRHQETLVLTHANPPTTPQVL